MPDFNSRTGPPKGPRSGIANPEVAGELLEKAGLKLTKHLVMEPAWEMNDPSDLFETFLTATVGARMLIRSQTDKIVQAIRDQVTQTVAEQFKHGKGYRVPAHVAVMTAERE